MILISPDIWAQLESARPTDDALVGRVLAPDVTKRLLAAVDSRGWRHLLVALSADDQVLSDESSRGLTVLTRDLRLKTLGGGRYIDIACSDPIGHPMLDVMASDIAPRLQSGDVAPCDSVSRVLGKWRRFWGQAPSRLLSKEAQIGLFAELWFLAYWLIPSIGINRGVQMWRGPHGSRHDFERPGLSIEAKGTSATRGRIHKVHGLQQLEPPERGRLLFFSLRVREEAGASNTLPILCQACRTVVSKDPDAEGLYDAALAAAGYLTAHEEEYSKVRFRVLEDLLFATDGDFPRVTLQSFGGALPAGVEAVEYSINLTTFDALVVARTASDATPLLL